MNKKYLYAGGAAAVLLAWRYSTYRRDKQAQLAGPEAALSYTVRIPAMSIAVGKQIARATAGERLTDYAKALDASKFWGAPPTNVDAYLTAAFWLAVASRVLGKRALAASAYAMSAKGGALYAIPGSSMISGGVSGILSDAGMTLRAAGGTNKQIQGILAILKQQGSPAAVAAVQARVKDKEVVQNTGKQSAEDAGDLLTSAANFIRDGIGLARPDGTKPPWWKPWLIRGGAAAAILLGLGVALGGPIRRAQAAASDIYGRALAAQKALTGPVGGAT